MKNKEYYTKHRNEPFAVKISTYEKFSPEQKLEYNEKVNQYDLKEIELSNFNKYLSSIFKDNLKFYENDYIDEFSVNIIDVYDFITNEEKLNKVLKLLKLQAFV